MIETEKVVGIVALLDFDEPVEAGAVRTGDPVAVSSAR